MLDELEAWEDNEIEKKNKFKNEIENYNENNKENEDEVTSSSCDGDKNNFKENQTKTNDGEQEDSAAVIKETKENQTKINDGEQEDSAADGEKEDSTADGEKDDSAADGEKGDSAAANKETKAETEPKTAHGSNQEKLLNEASKKNRSMKQQTKIVQENENLSQSFRKRKFVHEYVNLSFKKFKFMELPDTEPPPPVPTLHQLPSQLKMSLHVGLPPSQVPSTLGAGTLGPYRQSYNKVTKYSQLNNDTMYNVKHCLQVWSALAPVLS